MTAPSEVKLYKVNLDQWKVLTAKLAAASPDNAELHRLNEDAKGLPDMANDEVAKKLKDGAAVALSYSKMDGYTKIGAVDGKDVYAVVVDKDNKLDGELSSLLTQAVNSPDTKDAAQRITNTFLGEIKDDFNKSQETTPADVQKGTIESALTSFDKWANEHKENLTATLNGTKVNLADKYKEYLRKLPADGNAAVKGFEDYAKEQIHNADEAGKKAWGAAVEFYKQNAPEELKAFGHSAKSGMDKAADWAGENKGGLMGLVGGLLLGSMMGEGGGLMMLLMALVGFVAGSMADPNGALHGLMGGNKTKTTEHAKAKTPELTPNTPQVVIDGKPMGVSADGKQIEFGGPGSEVALPRVDAAGKVTDKVIGHVSEDKTKFVVDAVDAVGADGKTTKRIKLDTPVEIAVGTDGKVNLLDPSIDEAKVATLKAEETKKLALITELHKGPKATLSQDGDNVKMTFQEINKDGQLVTVVSEGKMTDKREPTNSPDHSRTDIVMESPKAYVDGKEVPIENRPGKQTFEVAIDNKEGKIVEGVGGDMKALETSMADAAKSALTTANPKVAIENPTPGTLPSIGVEAAKGAGPANNGTAQR